MVLLGQSGEAQNCVHRVRIIPRAVFIREKWWFSVLGCDCNIGDHEDCNYQERMIPRDFVLLCKKSDLQGCGVTGESWWPSG